VHKRNVRFDPVAVEHRIQKTRPLAIHMAAKYARRYPCVCLQDLVQDCLSCLTRAAQLYNDKPGGPPFSAFALLCLKQMCWAHVAKVRRRSNEVSLDDVLSHNDDGSFTVLDSVELTRARKIEARRIPDANAEKILDLVRHLINTLETLTLRERKILRFKYRGWDVPRIARRIRVGPTIVSTEAARGIRKLRQAFRDLGYRALSPRARVKSAFGTGRPKALPKRS
jgi:RNA polymerase sigma factor (sigma-70 family)